MHIGFLTFESPYGDQGGVASYLRAIIPVLIDAGHRVTLITAGHKEGLPEDIIPKALRIVPVRLPNAHWYVSKLPLFGPLLTLPLREAEWSVAFYKAMENATRQDPLDVLETTELGSWWVARQSSLPVIVRTHGADYTFRRHMGDPISLGCTWNRSLQRGALRNAAAVTAPSVFQAVEVAREMNWKAERVAVIPNAISNEMLERSISRRSGCSADSPTILYTGRLASVKGTSLLLQAATEVIKEFPRAQFVLAGPWQMPTPVRDWSSQLKHLGLHQNVTWLGSQDRDQLAELYSRATVFVMPSYYETFGISCLEAMAFGLPVVATRAGALPEVTQHEQTGLLTTPGDKSELANALVRILQHPAWGRDLGTAGRQRVLANFTPVAVKDRTIDFYEATRRLIQ